MSKEYIEWGRQYWCNVNENEGDLHAILGITSEAGELADLYKKLLATGKSVTEAQVIDECGDLLYYMARLLDSCNSSFEEAFAKNRVKLDYRMAHGKNKEMEAQLQSKVTISIGDPEIKETGGEYKYG